MDTGRLTELRRWATRLQETSSNEETRAAGKAILMLADEVEQLTLRLEAGRAASRAAAEESAAELPGSDADDWDEVDREHGTRAWLRRTFGLSPVEPDDVNADDSD